MSTRVDSSTPLAYKSLSHDGTRNPAIEYESPQHSDDEDVEAGTKRKWWAGFKKRKRRTVWWVVGAVSAAVLMVIAGVVVGVILAMSG